MPDAQPAFQSSQPHVIIGGFGIPGRHAAELLASRDVPCCAIDLNPATAARCARNITVLTGDMRDPRVLQQAGIDRARLVLVTVPDDAAAIEIVRTVRQLRPDVPLLARCAYTSAGLKAQQLGATAVVVAEQLVARELHGLVEAAIGRPDPGPRDRV